MNTSKPYALLLVLLIASIASAQAAIVSRYLDYPIDGEAFRAYIAYDDAIQNPRPGIVIYPEWWGQSDYERGRAQQLAKLGYVALVADMYGVNAQGAIRHTDQPAQAKEWMTAVTTDKDWWRERAQAAIDQLRALPQSNPKQTAAIGYCFGGGTVLQLAYGGADLKGIVSFHGSLPTPDKGELQAIKTKLLIQHGDADPFVADDMENAFRQALASSQVDWTMTNYGGVRHSFTNPAADSHGMAALHYDARADRRSWAAMQAFFNELFE